MPIKERFEAARNGLIAVAYLWLAIAIMIAPRSIEAIQTLDTAGQNTITVSCVFFAAISFVGLITKSGLLRPNNFTRDETILPLIGVFALAVYMLPSV